MNAAEQIELLTVWRKHHPDINTALRAMQRRLRFADLAEFAEQHPEEFAATFDALESLAELDDITGRYDGELRKHLRHETDRPTDIEAELESLERAAPHDPEAKRQLERLRQHLAEEQE